MKNHIKELRTKRGMTQAALSKACGIHSRHLQKLESGERDIENAQLKTLLALSDVLEVKIEELFEREPSPAAEMEHENET